MIPPNSGIVEPTRLVLRRAGVTDGVFVGVPEHAADLLGRAREHERIRRAVRRPSASLRYSRRDVLCEKADGLHPK